MTDFASLGIRIDSSQVKTGAAALDDLAKSGDRAEKSIDAVASVAGKSAKGFATAQRAAAAAAKSVDEYVKQLQTTVATNGLNARQTQLYELAVRGASEAQLKAADSAIRLNEAYERGVSIGERVKSGLKAIAALSIASAAAGAVAFSKLADEAGKYKSLGEQIGDTASAVSSLQLAADTSGKSIDDAANFSIRLTKALSQTDDESKRTGKGLTALGLNFDDFKKKSPVEQLEAIAKALQGFKAGPGQTAALEAIVKGGAQLLPFFNDLADAQERQVRLTDAQIARADAFSKAQTRSASNMKALAETIVVETLPAIADLTDSATEVIKQVTGLGKEANTLRSNTSIADFAEGAGRALAGMADYVAGSVRELRTISDFIGATAESAAKIGTGDFAGARKIGSDFRERYGLDEFGRKIKGAARENANAFVDAFNATVAARKLAADPSNYSLEGRNRPKPDVNQRGLNGDRTGKTKGQTTEKDLLGFDIALIKRDLDQLTNAYKDSQSIIEALHQAGLVEDRDYYESKREFIALEADTQVRALQRENASFRESIDSRRGTDKDRLESQRKIEDNENKIADVRSRASAQTTILGIQETSSLNKVAQSYRDAEAAAQSYLDTLRLGQQRTLDGFGIGNQNRDRVAGRAQVEDRFNQQRQGLEKDRRNAELSSPDGKLGTEAQKKYDDELDRIKRFQAAALSDYDAYYAELLKKQQDGSLGAIEALQNYVDESQKAGKQIEDAFTRGLGGIEDAFVSLAITGKADFKSLANSIIADIIRIQVKAALTGSGASGGGLIGSLLSLFKYGGSSSNPSAGNYTNSLDQGFPLARGTDYVPYDNFKASLHEGERVVPKAFNPAANLSAARGAAGAPIVNITNNTPATVQTSVGNDGSVELIIEAAAERAHGRMVSDLASGTGPSATAVRGRFGLGAGNLRRRG